MCINYGLPCALDWLPDAIIVGTGRGSKRYSDKNAESLELAHKIAQLFLIKLEQ
jgi:hypothetical protein